MILNLKYTLTDDSYSQLASEWSGLALKLNTISISIDTTTGAILSVNDKLTSSDTIVDVNIADQIVTTYND